MRKLLMTVFTLVLTFSFIGSALAQDDMDNDKMMKKDDKMMKNGKMKNDKMMMKDNPMVGGAAMYRNKNIVENAMNSKDHTTLVAAVKAAELVDPLMNSMALTVFAPENSAFSKLPAGTVDTLLKPENKEMLQNILKYHVIVGNLDSGLIMKAIERGNGKAMFATLSGDMLTMMMEGDKLVLMDEKGGKSMVTIANVRQSNGYIHSIDSVLMPN